MVEAATEETYAQALRRQVLRPLRLRRTSLPSVVDLSNPFIHGYEPGESGEPEDISEIIAFGGWAWASGGIVSTPADLTRFVRGYVGGGFTVGACVPTSSASSEAATPSLEARG